MTTPNTYNIEHELNILDPKNVRIYKDEFNRLRLEIIGEVEYLEVKAIMNFPLTNPDSFISFVEVKDGKKEQEIGVIEDVKKLDNKSKKVLRDELKRAYFMPEIVKINSLKEYHGIMKFDVETDKGRRVFETRYKEDIRKLPKGNIAIKDADGNRYVIKDFRKLDERSMNLIDTEI